MKKLLLSFVVSFLVFAQGLSLAHAVEHGLDESHIAHECTLCSASSIVDSIDVGSETTGLVVQTKQLTQLPFATNIVVQSLYSNKLSREPPVL